jgi:hypothetical protein
MEFDRFAEVTEPLSVKLDLPPEIVIPTIDNSLEDQGWRSELATKSGGRFG